MYRFRTSLFAWLLLVPALGGCAFNMGGGKTVTVVETTTGDELADLKKARDAGAITDAEYEELKKVILAR